MNQETKKWWASKSVWTAVVTVGVTIAKFYGAPIPVEIYGLLGALGLYSLRTADKPIA
jgi:hypothetical protein